MVTTDMKIQKEKYDELLDIPYGDPVLWLASPTRPVGSERLLFLIKGFCF